MAQSRRAAVKPEASTDAVRKSSTKARTESAALPSNRAAPDSETDSGDPVANSGGGSGGSGGSGGTSAAGPSAAAAKGASVVGGPRILKKYPNRRLYDTQLSTYITLADVKAMVLAAQSFEVRDAKTGEDLTRSILLQIILEEESGGVPIFSAPMLSQIIRFYGHSMQAMMGSYLEKNLQTFTEIQAKLTEQSKGLLEPVAQTPEMWTKYLNGQAPAVQGLMGNYMEQSRKMFVQMQEQMAKQAGTLFPGMPGFVPPKR